MESSTIVILISVLILAVFGILHQNDTASECSDNSDCVAAQCCHSTSCVPKAESPDCRGIFCTAECMKDTMDCGGYCACIDNTCKAILKNG